MTVLQSLARLHGRLESNGRAPSYGFLRENISFVVVLSRRGEPVDVQDVRDTSSKTPRPRRIVVPRPVKRTGQPAPNFLWDKTAFSLGVKRDDGANRPVPALRDHTAFKDFHRRLLADADDEAIRAFLLFLNVWKTDDYERLRYAQEMLYANIAFRLDGGHEFLHDCSPARAVWLNHLANEEGAGGLCLVTGEHAPIVRLHPSVKGVAGGAQRSGASIVSFEKDAFKSFCKERGANAPVSERAAFAYTAALNTLLERNSRQRIRIGDTTTVFWAESVGDPSVAEQAEELFSILADPPTDDEKAAEVADKLYLVAQGRPLAEVNPEVDENAPFYVLGLAPNAARLSIRFWHQDSIGAIARRIGEHFRDMRIEPTPWRTPPAARRVLYETAVQGKAENIPPTLSGALMRSILTGQPYPRTLMAAVVTRLRVDGRVSGLRGAILRACIVRELRVQNRLPKEEYLVSLDKDSGSVAYNLGRLFAAFAYAERSLADRNATIRDKYMSAASTTPRRVFPILLRGYEHNRSGLSKGHGQKPGAGIRVDQAVVSIIDRIPSWDDLPTTFPLEDQGRFFIGYYHQERDWSYPDSVDRSGLSPPALR